MTIALTSATSSASTVRRLDRVHTLLERESAEAHYSAWPGTVSISHTTLTAVVIDVVASLRRSGIERLALVNGHGGNYVLSNIVQEANVGKPVMALFPTREDWETARTAGGLATGGHDDMHAGEIEVSILRHVAPDLVKPGVEAGDHHALDRKLLLMRGMAAYPSSGVIGAASEGTAEKGRLVLDSLVAGFKDHLDALTAPD